MNIKKQEKPRFTFLVDGAFLFYLLVGGEMNMEINTQIEIVCQQFIPLVKKYAWKYKGSIEDSESEAWLIIVSAVGTYDAGARVPLAGYLESKIKYGMFNLWRQQKKRQEHLVNDDLLERMPSKDNPQMEIEQKEGLESISELIDQLTPKQRFVIIHNVINGYKLEYIAKVLGITIQAVCQIKKRGLARLKNNLE